MLNEFRIKQGGRGNVVSIAQSKGLTQATLRDRNSCVEATPFSKDYENVLIILYANRYQEQLQVLFEEFNKKATNVDYLEDLGEIAQQAYSIFNGANPPNFLIVYAKSIMLNKSLIHYNKKPQINMNEDGSYREESGKILLSNNGVISAKIEESESPCVFYHPFAWQYIVERLDFIASWSVNYEGYEIGSSDALLETEVVPYRGNHGRFIGFAPFGLKPNGASTVGDLTFQKDSQFAIAYAWERPSYVEQYTQMREGESYVSLTTAPLKYTIDGIPNAKMSEILDDGTILDDESLDFLPIFVTYSDSDTLPLTKILPNKTDNTYPNGIALSSVESVIDLAQLQRYSQLKTPYKRSTNLETKPTYQEDIKYVARDYMKAWAEQNLVPPHMSNEEWWNNFYDRLALHLGYASELECGEYDNGSANLCGVVYAMNQQFRLIDDYVSCKAYELPYGTQGMQNNIFRSTDYAGDYKTVMTAVQVGANDDFSINSEITFSTRFYTEVKFRIKMNIGSNWTMLPEEVVRTSLSRFTEINNAIYSDCDLSTAVMARNGREYGLSLTDYGANIPLSAILADEGIDFNLMYLAELVDTLRKGFDCRLRFNSSTGTYVGIGAKPVNMVENWRNK